MTREQQQKEERWLDYYLSRAELNDDLRKYAQWTGRDLVKVALMFGYTIWSDIYTKTVICDYHKDTTSIRRYAVI